MITPEQKTQPSWKGYWNYRIMRMVEIHPTMGESITYGIVEAHYENRGDAKPHSWSEEYCHPMGETLGELTKDFAWFLTALTKPVLDENGNECAPAVMLADDLQKWLDARAEAKGEVQ